MLVSLGIFAAPCEVISLVGGIVLITYVCWAINRAFGAPVPVWGPEGQEDNS